MLCCRGHSPLVALTRFFLFPCAKQRTHSQTDPGTRYWTRGPALCLCATLATFSSGTTSSATDNLSRTASSQQPDAAAFTHPTPPRLVPEAHALPLAQP